MKIGSNLEKTNAIAKAEKLVMNIDEADITSAQKWWMTRLKDNELRALYAISKQAQVEANRHGKKKPTLKHFELMFVMSITPKVIEKYAKKKKIEIQKHKISDGVTFV